MKKRLLPFCLLFVLLLLLGACTKNPSQPVDTSDGEVSAEETNDRQTSESETDNSPETTGPLPSLLSGEYASSIEHAERLRGEVNVAYSHNRLAVTLSNRNGSLCYPLNGRQAGSSLTTPDGGTYLSALPEIYIRNTAGETFSLTDTGIGERMNIYRLGSYYYEVHMLDGGVGYEVLQSKELNIKMFRSGHSVDHVGHTDEGSQFTVTSTSDPYINGGTLSFDTALFNGMEITLSTTDSSFCQVYVAAGSHAEVNEDQSVTFPVEPDGSMHTYVVSFADLPDYQGELTKLRLDIGSRVGETVCIQSVKMVQLADDAPAIKLDHTFHLYSDKINDVIRLVAAEEVSDLAAVGTVTRIPAATVEKLIIQDKNGTHTAPDGVDYASTEYIGFDIKGAGVYGVILLPDETSGHLSLTREGDDYVLTREYLPAQQTLSEGESIRSGVRIYTDLNHTFDAFLKTAEIERHPLTEVYATTSADDACYVGYDVFRGAYRFEVSGHSFPQAFADPDRRFIIGASFTGVEVDYPIYVYSWTLHGNLESGALLSNQNKMLPIALEVSKNFQGENEEPFYVKGDGAYGEILFPMVIEAGKTTEFSIVNLYQNWGNYPLKQISSIQFIAPYYHLSTGSTETNCIAPYYVHGRDHWLLPDFRAMSAPLWPDQPQHASIGRLYFLRYRTTDGITWGTESVNNKIDSYGPTYSDIDMNYLSTDGKISVSFRHLEYPQWDENRTYYTMELTVNEPVEIEDFKRDLSFFSFDGREYFFKKLGYLNEQNECVVVDASTDSEQRYIMLGSRSPYISYFDGNETEDLTRYVNFALIIKDSEITIGGQTVQENFVLRENKSDELNRMSLSMDLGHVTLQPGDRFVIHMILLPWGDPSSENDQNVRDVREDSCLQPYGVTATVGTVVEDAYLPRIIADSGVAEFTLSGGAEASAVWIYGWESYTGIRVQEKVNGEWVDYVLHSKGCDYDGYTVSYDGDGTFSYSFIVNMDNGPRTFRVTAD